MNNENPKRKRKLGGTSFADAMIRSNVDTGKYVEYVLTIVSRRILSQDDEIKIITYKNDIFIFINDKLLISLCKEDVERYRQERVLAFDEFIIGLIKEAGYKISESSGYYKVVMGIKD